MNIETFINSYVVKYKDALIKLAHEEDCKFAISVFETPTNFIGIYNKEPKFFSKASNINDCISVLKYNYPELKNEEGIKYYPLNLKYYDV